MESELHVFILALDHSWLFKFVRGVWTVPWKYNSPRFYPRVLSCTRAKRFIAWLSICMFVCFKMFVVWLLLAVCLLVFCGVFSVPGMLSITWLSNLSKRRLHKMNKDPSRLPGKKGNDPTLSQVKDQLSSLFEHLLIQNIWFGWTNFDLKYADNVPCVMKRTSSFWQVLSTD